MLNHKSLPSGTYTTMNLHKLLLVPGFILTLLYAAEINAVTSNRAELFEPLRLFFFLGDNILAVLRHLVMSEKLADSSEYRHGNMVFFDLLGVVVVAYPARVGTILNYMVATATFLYLAKKASMPGNGGGSPLPSDVCSGCDSFPLYDGTPQRSHPNLIAGCFSLRGSLRSGPGLRHWCGGPELVRHLGVCADRSSDRHSDGPLHVLVQPLLCLRLPVRGCCHGQDDPHSHAGQEPVLWSKC